MNTIGGNMTYQLSFSKQEQEIRKLFRDLLSKAESMEDVKKFFYQTVRDLLKDICDPMPEDVAIHDIQLDLDRGEGYLLSDSLMDGAKLRPLMQDSDLDVILERLSEHAWGRYRRLEKNPAKTESKMYPIPGR